MKIVMSRRNFLLGASAVVAFSPQFVKRVQAIEADMFESFSQISRAHLLSPSDIILATVNTGVTCTKTDDRLTLEMPNFIIERSGLAERIAFHDNETMMFMVSLVDRSNVTLGNTAHIDLIHVGAPIIS